VNAELVRQALWYVAQALDTSGFNVTDEPIDEAEWAEFIDHHGNMGAYLLSAHSTLRELRDRVEGRVRV
jgi:hypothetical protein